MSLLARRGQIPKVELSILKAQKYKPPVSYRKVHPVRWFLWVAFTIIWLLVPVFKSSYALYQRYVYLDSIGWSEYLSRKYGARVDNLLTFSVVCQQDAKCTTLFSKGVFPTPTQALGWLAIWGLVTALLLWRTKVNPTLSMTQRLATYEDLAQKGFIERRRWEELKNVYLKGKEEYKKYPAGYAGTFVDDKGRVHFFRLPWNIASLHTLTIGGTGFGKTVSVFYPRLLLDAIEGAVSVVLDIKYPNPNDSYITARDFYEAFGRKVWIINPFEKGVGLNIPILEGVRRPEEANTIAYYLYPPGLEEKDPRAAVYISNARKTLAAMIYALARSDSGGEVSFRRIHELANKGGAAIREWFRNTKDASSLIESTLGLRDDILNGVLNRIAVDTEMFVRPEVNETFMSGPNNLDMTAVFTKPGMVHMVFPEVELRSEAGTALLRLLKQYLDAQLLQLAERLGGSLPIPVRMYYDEFYVFGRLPNIAKDFGTFRSRNITLQLAVQNLAMPRELYDKEWDAATANNIGLLTLLAGSLTPEEAEEWSKLLGETSVFSVHATEGRHIEPMEVAELGHSGSAAVRETKRRLITPEELRSMPIGTGISLTRGVPPVITHLPLLEDPWSPLHGAYLEVEKYRAAIRGRRLQEIKRKALNRIRYMKPTEISYDEARGVFEQFLELARAVEEKRVALYGTHTNPRRYDVTELAQAVLDESERMVLRFHRFFVREGNKDYIDFQKVPYPHGPLKEWFAEVVRNNVLEEHIEESYLEEPEGGEDLRPDGISPNKL